MSITETGIYEIRNLVNGKRYVGSAVHFKYRWTKHRTELAENRHHSRQRAWNKYGAEAFEFKHVLICARANLIMYEQAAMDAFKPEYNVAPQAGSCAGVVRTAEAIAKTVATRLARGGWSPSAETRAKISETLKGQPGRPHTPESRSRMSVVQRARGAEHLREVWERKRGVPRAPEVRVKLSQANAKFTEDQVREIRARCAAGELQREVARQVGIRQSCVSEIVRGVTYAWVKF